MLKSLYQLSNDFIGLLFPCLCNACGGHLVKNEQEICTNCLYDLPFTDYHIHRENRVAQQFWGRLPITNAMAMLYFNKGGKVQQLLHNLKYRGKTDLGALLGKMVGRQLQASQAYQTIDLIVPVPLHQSKKRRRGYNQCTYLAKGLAESLGKPMVENQLLRLQKTESQTKKSRYLRFENMQGVFGVSKHHQFSGKHILLVDDVITTGGTIEACGNTLIKAGVAQLSVAAIAFAE